MSGSDVVIMVIATGLGACVQGSIGFGLGLIAAPVLALIDPSMVPGPVLAAGVPLTLAVLVRGARRSTSGRCGGRWAAASPARSCAARSPSCPSGPWASSSRCSSSPPSC